MSTWRCARRSARYSAITISPTCSWLRMTDSAIPVQPARRCSRTSPEGFYLDSYNYGELRKTLPDPLGPNGSRRYCSAIFDHVTDTPVSMHWSVADPNAILIFNGIFLHRPKLRDSGACRSSWLHFSR